MLTMMNLSTLSTMSIREERMQPPVRIIIKTLQATFPACHCNITITITITGIAIIMTTMTTSTITIITTITTIIYTITTSITTLQIVSIGIVMKEITASARVRWKTRKWTFVRLTRSTLQISNWTKIFSIWTNIMCKFNKYTLLLVRVDGKLESDQVNPGGLQDLQMWRLKIDDIFCV